MEPVTRGHYLTTREVLNGTQLGTARVRTTTLAQDHPEWDMAELKTWDDWEKEGL